MRKSLHKLFLLAFISCNLISYSQESLMDLGSFKNQLEEQPGDKDQNPFHSSQNNESGFNSEPAPVEFGTPPQLNWIHQFGGTADDISSALEIDKSGNIFVTGSFAGQLEFNGSTFNSTGNKEAFIAKIDNNGSPVWITTIPASTGNETHCNDISLDTIGNILITGYYTGTISIGQSTFPDLNNKVLFYAKLDSEGNVVNGNYHSEYYDEEGLFLDTDLEGNIYISSLLGLETGEIYHSSVLFKYNTNAELIWEKDFGKSFREILIIDSSIYFTGILLYGEDGYVDENVTLPTINSNNDLFVLKSDLNTVFEWGFAPSHTNWGESQGISLDTDHKGGFYLAGYVYGDVTFGALPKSTGQNFCLKFDEEGSFEWLSGIYPAQRTVNPYIAADSLGNSLLVVNKEIYKIDASGNTVLFETLDFSPSAVFFNTNDEIVLGGSRDGLVYTTKIDLTASPIWSNQLGGNSGQAQVIDLECDSLGNVYTFSYTRNTIHYFGHQVYKGLIFSKHNENGELLWHHNFEGVVRDYYSKHKSINLNEETGNVILTGNYYDSLKITESKTLVSNNGEGTFILKYDLNGNLIWDINEEFPADEPSVVTNTLGEVIFSFTFQDTIVISGINKIGAGGGQDGCIVKYDQNGAYLWAKTIAGEWTTYSCLVSTDNSNNIYVTAECPSTEISLDGMNITLNEGDGNMLLAKFESNGTLLWWNSYGVGNKFDDYNWQTGIMVDDQENIILKGWFRDTVYFQDVMITGSSNSFNYFIAKLDQSGNVDWAYPITEDAPWGFDYNLFDLDASGNIYFGAQIRDTIKFGEEFNYWPQGENDLFVSQLNTDGVLEWVKVFPGGINSYNSISSVKLDSYGNVLVGGYFNDVINIESQTLTAGNKHGFLMKLGDISDPEINSVNDRKPEATIEVYPNPSNGIITIEGENIVNRNIEVLTTSGQVIHTQVMLNESEILDLKQLPKGIYLLKVSGSTQVNLEKLIIK